MLWVGLIASIVGFLAVVPISNATPSPIDISNTALLWQLFFVALTITVIGMSLVKWWYARQQSVSIIQRFLLSGIIFIAVLLGSCSFGLLQLSHYQQALLTQPVTVEATITSQTLSDSVNVGLSASGTPKTLSYGTLYPRQIWQIIPSSLANEQPAITQPINVMVTANIANHPEWQATLNQLRPNATLQVKLALQPITQAKIDNLPNAATPLNLGFDQALWLRERNVQAVGEVLEIDKDSLSNNNQTHSTIRLTVEQWRWQFRQLLFTHFWHSIESYPSVDTPETLQKINALGDSHAILLGLLTGDKALMDSDIKGLYQVTGISHLLAISGPHVTLLASIVATLILASVKWMYPTLLLRLPSRLLILWVSVAVAGVYALLVGFELPAQRTFWLLLLVTLASQWLIASNAYRLLGVVGLLMVWADSTAVLQAGFWLSFVAVGLLLKFSQSDFDKKPIFADEQDNKTQRFFSYLIYQSWALFKLQLWLFVWMMPIVIWFFGKVSFIGLVVNMLAVPLLGLVVVPLDMLAGLLTLIPVVGEAIGGAIWSLLSQVLMLFHGVLAWLVDAGLAKQGFFSLSHSQLILLILAILLAFSRNLLPKMAIVPLLLACVAVSVARHQHSDQLPTLAVLDNAKVSISLLKKGNDSWLILADNQNLAKSAEHKTVTKTSFGKKLPDLLRSINQNNGFATRLNDDILALLATYHVDKLTGVINQTPSEASNAWVQTLASRITIGQYWLAGVNPLKPSLQNSTKITPKNCEFGQQWQSEDKRLTLTAVSGWQLDLPNEQISDDERLATQNCLLQITAQSATANQPYQTLLTAGRSGLPLAMSMKLCDSRPINLLINPYQTPLDKDWLRQSQPKILHILTGSYANEVLSDSSQFALADSQLNPAPQLVFASQSGAVEYTLQP